MHRCDNNNAKFSGVVLNGTINIIIVCCLISNFKLHQTLLLYLYYIYFLSFIVDRPLSTVNHGFM